MKKLTLVFSLFSLILFSCGNDDDNGDSITQDPFIATWQYYKYFEDGTEIVLEDCETQSTFQVFENGDFMSTFYELDTNDDCQIEGTTNGTWENVGNGFYSTTFDGETVTSEVHFDGNTLYFEDVDGGITYRDLYIKI
ncbi:lipocalin family protein [uncultured Olleya sp.]|uniref:lipocalin family protein n=1 Tax=uncultured Olleya sp. TaxID=757243 RepID=UPI002593F96D|nr:lipocalin family protein [uncultured Olleya sp.]